MSDCGDDAGCVDVVGCFGIGCAGIDEGIKSGTGSPSNTGDIFGLKPTDGDGNRTGDAGGCVGDAGGCVDGDLGRVDD